MGALGMGEKKKRLSKATAVEGFELSVKTQPSLS